MSRPRVLHVVGSLELGGGQKLTALVAAGLSRSGFDVTVLNLGSTGPYGDYLAARGVPVVHLDMPMRISPRGVWRTFRGVVRLWRILLRRPRWDLVHSHMFRTSMLVSVPARLAGSRLFGTSHRMYYRWQAPVERLLARLHEAIVVDSIAVGRILQEATRIPESRYVVIHNGIDIDEFATMPSRKEARQQLDLPGTATVISQIAHLAPHKGQIHLIRALARLNRDEALLLLAGDGPDRRVLERETRSLGLTDRVRFLGERSDLAVLLAASDILALPSTFEGFGIVQAEAMYAGLPVVGGDFGGATEVVVDGVTGFLVPFGDVERLADRLRQLVSSPEQRAAFGAAGKERVITQFTMDKMTARYVALYEGNARRGLTG